ncbi:MAG: prephenate dehydrogenase [Firmicutes bacterium]|nr:prephenate dehydrogenase [Bacillota bacterium]
MNVGILGLGLIGGSMARAYSQAGHRVFAADTDESILEFAQLSGVVQGVLSDETIGGCSLLLLAVYPAACVDFLRAHAPALARDALVVDLCGVKREVCEAAFPIAARYGFTFVGGHPMAGSHYSGYKYSRANLFHGTPMVLVPPVFDDIFLLQRCKDAFAPCGFGSFSVCTAEQHDARIAFTSQMPHILSNAFIKSPTARAHDGFSAGSYRDLTRVAWLNAPMWAELFLNNRENLLFELDTYIENLEKYRLALRCGDAGALTALLEEGKKRKEEVDG